MIVCLDTSVLTAALTHEAQTECMLRWLDDQDLELLAISNWVTTEFSSALSIKLRSGQIGAVRRAEALATSTMMSAETFTLLPISGAQFRTAARFADQHALGLRAGDALHRKRSSAALLPLRRTDVLGRPGYGVFELSLWMTLPTTRRVSSGGSSC